MLTLSNLFLFMLLAAAAAWLWHSHGIRERALQAVRRHCQKLDVELLDGNVAFRKLTLLPDARGQRRLARIYGFEFTVTGEQRHPGTIVMFGAQVGRIELAAHPFQPADEPGRVIQLDDWRRPRD
ncbi:DUF3301 domain-containing protein [Stutzerimonas sp. R40042]|uniref:DUF3301 domain-containing protein n=1 Tax=Stutzerimonas frequens TaxID=2968969 RepID=A0ABX6XXB9_9GAMM|nr:MULTISPECIES: DUF3301 domain-containing protein [Stutzerimonas]RRU77097.1 DUF3301 domain-containing protein [Stutzerimonas xanthomarina]MBK3873867.1 DUF3301 domain-containing protein [Stutzerimonas frequens]MBK3912136.1 DUF3301 domain-containing protein [Stutzerimonas frequens]MBK3931419.1 DUF3301 domain-containing protein [Stutzerimonas frequens]MCQ4305867.1 DUF3301 domain-containing protein [Stutzerimonas frequens]